MEIKPQDNSENCEKYIKSLKKRKRTGKTCLPKHGRMELIQTLSMTIKPHINISQYIINTEANNMRMATEKEKCVVSHEAPNVMSTNEFNDNMPVEISSIYNHVEHSINRRKVQAIRDLVLYHKTFHAKHNSFSSSNTPRTQSTFKITPPNKILMIISLNENINCNINQRLMKIDPDKNNSVIPTKRPKSRFDTDVDVNSLLEIMAITFTSFFHLLYKLNERMLRAKRDEANTTIIIKFNIKHFARHLILQYSQNKMIKQPPPESNLKVSCSNNFIALPSVCKSLDICIQRRCMTYSVSICKFNSISQGFLETLAMLFNSGKLSLDTYASQVPSVFKGGWYVRDLSQGYMLALLLRNFNVASLNVMRKLYFVIITSVTPNLTLRLNFDLAQGIFIAHDTVFEGCSLNITQWKFHEKDATKTTDPNPNKVICEVKRENCISNHDIDLKRSESNHSYYDSCSTLKNKSIIDYDESEDLANSIFYSESESFDVKYRDSNNGMDIKDSILTLTLSIDEISSAHDLYDARKACGDTNLADVIQMYNSKRHKSKSTVETSRMWLKQIYNESIAITSNLDISRLVRDNVINESIFNGFDECSHTLLQYWLQFKSDVVFKQFYKQLGVTVFHTLFSSVIPS